MTRKIVYIDMDGVLVDFESGLDRASQSDLTEYFGREDEIPGIFSLMDPMPGAVDGFHALSRHYDTYILSTASWRNPTAWSDKLRWVHRHLGYNLAFATTVSFSNDGDRDVYYQPVGHSSVVPVGDCKTISKNLSATDNPLLILKPGESKSVDAVFACKATDPSGVVNVMLETAAEPYASRSFFVGPLDGGETR